MQKLIFLLIATLILPSIALSNPLVGSWGWSKTNDTLVITFLDDSNFVLADNDQADGDGQPGIEVGTYTWNPSTGAFSATVTLDTNGEWGFSHSQNIENATVTGDTLAFTIVGEDVFELPRIASTSTSKKSVNITPIISLLLDDDNNGFTYAELSGNTFQFIVAEYPTCVYEMSFDNENTLITIDGGIFNYTINNGSIVIDNGNGVTATASVQSRSNSTITGISYTTSGSFEDRTNNWPGIDFPSLNNNVTNLKDWFVTNGWWPGSAILADGRVTNQDATIEGKWRIEENVLYIDHPGSDGCVDYKAYKLVNDRLMFATDAAHTSGFIIIKM